MSLPYIPMPEAKGFTAAIDKMPVLKELFPCYNG